MNTKEVAEKLVAYLREGKSEQAVSELYSDDIVSVENPLETGPGMEYQKREGMAAKKKFSEEWEAGIKEVHDDFTDDPIITANGFAVRMGMDITMKNGTRMKMEELALYRVKDGKIVYEEFWY